MKGLIILEGTNEYDPFLEIDIITISQWRAFEKVRRLKICINFVKPPNVFLVLLQDWHSVQGVEIYLRLHKKTIN